jgi:hypothetical protein
MKNCNKCQIEKEDTEFRHNRRVCKECEKEHGRNYRQQNKEKSQKWTSENKERMKELQSNWYKNNKEKINLNFKLRYHDKDSDFKKIKNYRTAINHMIGGNQKTNKYIGCNRDNLIEWLKFCFIEGMTMENYGTHWVVDHVIPLDNIKADDSLFDIVVKWNNIMPVLSEFNLVKNKKIISEQVKTHLQNIQQFFNNKKLKRDDIYEKLLAKHLDAGSPLEPKIPLL